MAAPFRMNSGIDSSVMLANSWYTFCVTTSSAASGISASMNTIAVAPSANAIGIPVNINTSVATP